MLSLIGRARSFHLRGRVVLVLTNLILGILAGRSVAQGRGELVLLLCGLATFAAIAWKRPAEMLLLWVAIGPAFQRSPGLVVSSRLPDLTVDRLFILTLTGIMFLHALDRRVRLFRGDAIEGSLLVFLVVVGMNLFFRGEVRRIRFVESFNAYVIPTAVFLLTRAFLGSSDRFAQWRRAVLLMATIQVGEGVLNILTGKITFYNVRVPVNVPSGIMTIRGFLTLPAAYGALLGMAFAVTWSAFLLTTGRSRVYHAVLLSLTAVMVFFSMARSTWVGLAGVVLVFLLMRAERLDRIVGIAGLVALVVLTYGPASDVLSRAWAWKSDSMNLMGRGQLTMAALARFASNPLFGAGPDAGYVMPEAAGFGYGITTIEVSHNTFASTLAGYGLVGFIPYALVIVLTVRRSLIYYRRLQRENRLLMVGLWGASVVWFLVMAAVEYSKVPILLSWGYMILAFLSMPELWVDERARVGQEEAKREESRTHAFADGDRLPA